MHTEDREQTDSGPNPELESRFTRVFAANLWQDPESISGPGSRVDSRFATEAAFCLRKACLDYSIRTINDIPCGDLNWISKFLPEIPHVQYTGYDIVKPLVDKNRATYPAIDCRILDITTQIPPKADLILCKDLIIHLNDGDIRKALRNIKLSGSTYLLATNNFGMPNGDLREHLHGDSACRYVDILTAPFGYPPPVWRTDYLGFWQLADWPDPSA